VLDSSNPPSRDELELQHPLSRGVLELSKEFIHPPQGGYYQVPSVTGFAVLLVCHKNSKMH